MPTFHHYIPIAPQIEQVSHHSYQTFIQTKPYVLLAVGTKGQRSFKRKVAEYFHNEYPDQFAFGWFNRDDMSFEWWRNKVGGANFWTTHISHIEGYYLFVDGEVVSHHSGRDTRTPDELKVELAVSLLALAIGAGGTSNEQRDIEATISYFEKKIKALQAEEQRAQTESEARNSTPPPPTPTLNPYEVLEVSEGATPEEIKRAFKLKATICHPDKVTHLDPIFQAVAEKRMKDLGWARDQLLAQFS